MVWTSKALPGQWTLLEGHAKNELTLFVKRNVNGSHLYYEMSD